MTRSLVTFVHFVMFSKKNYITSCHGCTTHTPERGESKRVLSVLPKNTTPQPCLTSYKLVNNDDHLFQTLGIHSTVRTESEDSGDGGDVVTESERGRRGQERQPPGLTPKRTLILTPGLTLIPCLEPPVNTRDTVNTENKNMEASPQTRSR